MSRFARQADVAAWCRRAFGDEQADSPPQRGLRLLEEAAEAAQAAGVDAALAHHVVAHVFSRPVGEIAQELGGVGVTLLAFANACGLSADECERIEAERVLAKPLEHFHKRNAEKNAAGLVARHIKPRGFVVLGEHFSTGWLVAGVVLVLAMSLASAVQEREAAVQRRELRLEALELASAAARALDDEATCEAVLSSCTSALGNGESCACWLDEDGRGGTWR